MNQSTPDPVEQKKMEAALKEAVQKIISSFGLAAAIHGINKKNKIPGDPTDEIMDLFSQHTARDGCPCYLVEPCSSACSCANPVMSGGCMRCAKYGSKEQRIASAEQLVNHTARAALTEHDWYAKNEVYQLNGKPLLPSTSFRVVELSKIRERVKALQEEEW